MKWCRSELVESHLTALGIPFRFEESIPLAQINVSKGLKNNARAWCQGTAVDEEVAQQYAAAAKGGAAFPPLVLYENGKCFDVVDGNHRLRIPSILKSKRYFVAAYILETDDQLLIAMATRTLNSINGQPQSTEERLKHAMALRDAFPSIPAAKAAKLCGVSVSNLNSEYRAQDTCKTLREHGIQPNNLKKGSLAAINLLKQSEPVMAEVGRVAVRNKLDTRETKELIAHVKSHHSESTQIEAAKEFEDHHTRFKSKPVETTTSPKSGFFRMLHGLFGIVAKHKSAEALHINSTSEFAEAKRDWLKLKTVMEGVFGK